MSESKFTKGEWIAFYPHELLSSGHVSVENEEGRQICISKVYKSNLDEGAANVRLIAAAPKMYKLLSEIKQVIDNGHELGEMVSRIQDFDEEIDPLLKEARGEQ